MLTRVATYAVLLSVVAAVEGAWLSRLPLPAAPDILLLIVIAAGVRRGLETGALLGAAAGYVRDLTSGSPLGVFTFAYLLTGVAAGSVMAVVDFSHRLAPALMAAAGTAVMYLVSGALVAAAGLASAPWAGFVPDLLGAVAINALVVRAADALYCRVEQWSHRPFPEKAIGYRILR
jgi:rod shape-determining protein MreD